MKHGRNLAYLLLLVIPFAIPLFVTNEYYIHVFIMCFINIMLASSLRAISTTGQFSLGHAGFMNIGAYTSGVLVMKLGFSPYIGLFLGGIGAMVLAAAIAYPVTRVRTVYFAMLTMFLGEVIRLVITEARSITGGSMGLMNIPPLKTISILGVALDFSTRVPNYYFILVLMLIVLLFLYRVERAYIGMEFKAIAQDESLAASCGINIARFKAIIFCIGCFIAGISGAFYTHYMSVLTPDSFGLFVSIYVLIYAVVGGLGKFGGPIIGAVVLTLVPEMVRVLKEYQPFIFVAVLYIVVFFLPGGLVDFPRRVGFMVGEIKKGGEVRVRNQERD